MQSVIDGLANENLAVRLKTWNAIFNDTLPYGKILFYFQRKIGDRYIAQDLAQDLFLKFYQRIVSNPLIFATEDKLKGYIWVAAQHVWDDYGRQLYKERNIIMEEEQLIHLSDPQPNIESLLIDYEQRDGLLNHVLHLPHPVTRFCVLATLANLTPHQISFVLPISKRTVERHLQRGITYLQRTVNDIHHQPPVWAVETSYQQIVGILGLTFLDPDITNLSPDSQRAICSTMGLSSPEEITQHTMSGFTIHEVNHHPRIRIAFIPRYEMSWRVFDKNKVHYLDFQPTFQRERVNGRQQEVLHLDNALIYSSEIEKEVRLDSNELSHLVWRYHMPHTQIVVDKLFNPFHHLPQRRIGEIISFNIHRN